jgi:hypothetical protein
MSMTDFIVFMLLLFYLAHGWYIGFLRSILTPACFILCVLFAVINFDLNYNIVHSSLIVILGTFILSTIMRTFLLLMRRTVDKEFRNYVFWGSRLLGSIGSVCWRGVVTAVILLLVTLMPAQSNNMADLQNDILKSRAYSLVYQYGLDRVPIARHVVLTLSIFKDPAKTRQLSEMREFQAFFGNPNVKSLMADPNLTNALNKKNFLALLSNPYLKSVLFDQYLMKTLSNLSEKIYRETSAVQK